MPYARIRALFLVPSCECSRVSQRLSPHAPHTRVAKRRRRSCQRVNSAMAHRHRRALGDPCASAVPSILSTTAPAGGRRARAAPPAARTPARAAGEPQCCAPTAARDVRAPSRRSEHCCAWQNCAVRGATVSTETTHPIMIEGVFLSMCAVRLALLHSHSLRRTV